MFQVKSYNPDKSPAQFQFYVLCKGENSGKPSNTPWVNSFVVIADSHVEMQELYWLCYALWRSGRLRPYLRGAAIPFIVIREFAPLLRERQRSVSPEVVGKVVTVLATLDESEAAACKQLKAIMEMRQIVLRSL